MTRVRDRHPSPPGTHPPLPMRDGVGASCVSLPPGRWARIADFLVERFPAVTAAEWAARMAAGEVVDEHGRPVDAARAYEAPLRVYYYRWLEAERRVPFEARVLHRDAHLLVADKPHFLPVAPVGKYVQETLLVRLKRSLGLEDLVPLHRIDRETAGLVLFSTDRATRHAYHTLFAERRMEKHYEAIVAWPAGTVLPPVRRSRLVDDVHFMRMREVPGEPNAETRLQLLEVRGGLARLRLTPVSGRRHQLRVHCEALGLPILNDAIYPVLRPEGADDHARPLQLLARELAFEDPVTGEPRRFESAQRLRLDGAADASLAPR